MHPLEGKFSIIIRKKSCPVFLDTTLYPKNCIFWSNSHLWEFDVYDLKTGQKFFLEEVDDDFFKKDFLEMAKEILALLD